MTPPASPRADPPGDSPADKPYNEPELYDIAFDFRDVPADVDVILGWATRAGSGRAPRRTLELACGPAYHTIELARRGIAAEGLDLTPAMRAYAVEKARRAGVAILVHGADMVDFDLGPDRRYDLTLCLLESLSHVYTLDAMLSHLASVRRHLVPGGIYVTEQSHPFDHLTDDRPVHSDWVRERGDVEIETFWGKKDDEFDPTTQVRVAQVEMRVRRGGREERVIRETCRMKVWLAPEMEAAIRLSGAFEIVERHGGWRLDSPFDDAEDSWRMIHVLRAR